MVNKSYSELIGGFDSFEDYQNGFISLSQEKNEHSFWATAIEEDTQESYNRYLDKYPNGSSVEEAKKRLEELEIEADNEDWEKAKKLNNRNSYYTYLKKYPSGIYVEKARKRIEELEIEADRKAWEKAKRFDSIYSYVTYRQNYSNGIYTDKAKKRIKELEIESDNEVWEKAEKLNSRNSYRTYLKNYSNGLYVKEAKIKIDEFDRIKKERLLEEKRYEEVKKQKERDRLSKIEKEKQLEDEEAWQKALDGDKKSDFEEYLKNYKIYKTEATDKLNQILEKEKEIRDDTLAWEKAEKENTESSYKNYLYDYPNGIYSLEVKNKIEKSNILITSRNIGILLGMGLLFVLTRYILGYTTVSWFYGILIAIVYAIGIINSFEFLENRHNIAPLILLNLTLLIFSLYFGVFIEVLVIVSLPFISPLMGLFYIKVKIKE